MRTYAQKPLTIQQTKTDKSTNLNRPHYGRSREVASILQLQRTMGNQAMRRSLPSNAEELQGSVSAASTHFNHDFSQIPIFSPTPARVQPKLTVSTAGDIHEQEADRIADKVMRISEPQPQCAWPCDGDCPKYENQQDDQKQILTKPTQEHDVGEAISSIEKIVSSPGQPLNSIAQSFFEPRFDHNFSKVRVYTDSVSALSARNINALAYTFGNHIVFGSGIYQPQTSAGRQLLAHELAHVVQQETKPSLPRMVQRQPRQDRRHHSSADGLSEVRRQQLHQLALRPGQLATLWTRLSGDEQSEIILAMDRAYGQAFTNRFYWYASHGQLRLGFHILPRRAEGMSYPDARGFAVGHPRDRGYIHVETFSNGTQVWLHPSGLEIWLTSPTTPQSASPGLERVRDLLLQARQLLALGMGLEAGSLLDSARAVAATLDESEQTTAADEIQAIARLVDPLGLELWR